MKAKTTQQKLKEMRYCQKKAKELNKEHYSVRSIFSNTWAMFYILLGGRGCGKTFNTLAHFLHEWKTKKKPFTWIRLTESAQKNLLQNKAQGLIDPLLRRQFDLDLTVKGCQVFDHGEPMCKVLALSTFYNNKGQALYDSSNELGWNICLDEMNRENSSEKRTFDIGTAFYNQMVNLIRNETEKVRIVLIGNTLEEASDIMCLFNFIPEEFGRYKLRKKKAVIDYIPPSEKYLEKNEKGVLGILASESSSFTNKIEIDTTLIDKSRLIKPIYCIKFKDAKFTVWDDGIVAKWNGEMVRVVPMAPYLDEVFSVELRDEVYQIYHNRRYRFRNLITQKEFKKELALLKGRG